MVFAKLVLHVRIKFTEDKRKRYVLAVIINGVIVLFVTLIALSTEYSKFPIVLMTIPDDIRRKRGLAIHFTTSLTYLNFRHIKSDTPNAQFYY